MNLAVVESHHHVLPFWGETCQRLEVRPRLLTLDFHTDTRRSEIDLTGVEGKDVEQLQNIVREIRNDEHIMAALDLGHLDSAVVINHMSLDSSLVELQAHRLIYKEIESSLGTEGKKTKRVDTVLESSFLRSCIRFADALYSENEEPLFSECPYILDVDLDYFRTRTAMKPNCSAFFQELVSHAQLVTVALEPEYVKGCRLEYGLDSSELLIGLGQLLQSET